MCMPASPHPATQARMPTSAHRQATLCTQASKHLCTQASKQTHACTSNTPALQVAVKHVEAMQVQHGLGHICCCVQNCQVVEAPAIHDEHAVVQRVAQAPAVTKLQHQANLRVQDGCRTDA